MRYANFRPLRAHHAPNLGGLAPGVNTLAVGLVAAILSGLFGTSTSRSRALEARLRERMRGELKDLQRRTGVTFVHVTHDEAEARAVADRVAVMDAGRIERVGRLGDVP